MSTCCLEMHDVERSAFRENLESLLTIIKSVFVVYANSVKVNFLRILKQLFTLHNQLFIRHQGCSS